MDGLTPQEALGELSDMREDFVEMLGRIAFAQDQLGRAYHYAELKRLAQVAGFKSTWDYFSRHFKELTRETLTGYLLMTFRWSSEVTRKYGMERLQVLDEYLYLHGSSHPGTREPGVLLIRVPQSNGTEVRKPFPECGLEELRRAARPRRGPTRGRPSATDSVRLLFLGDKLTRHFQGVAEVRVGMRTQPDGKSFLTVQGVPMTELGRFITALQDGVGAQPVSLRAGNEA